MTPSIPMLKKVFKLNREEYNIVSRLLQKELFNVKEDELLEEGYELFDPNTYYLKNEILNDIDKKYNFLSQGEYNIIYAPILIRNKDGKYEALISIFSSDLFLFNHKILKEIVGDFVVNELMKITNIKEFFKKILSTFLNSLITDRMSTIDLINGLRNALSQKFKVKPNETIYYKDGSIKFDNNIKQINSLLLYDYFAKKIGLPSKSKLPFTFTTQMPEKLEDINNIGLSTYQAATLNSMKYSLETILGLAGAGKTYLSKKISENYLLLHSLYFAKHKKSLGIGYVSYSKESISRGFIEKFENHKPLYFDLNEGFEIFKNTVERKLNEIEQLYNIETIEKLKAIEEKLLHHNEKELVGLEKYLNFEKEFLNSLNSTMSSMEINYFYETIEDLEKLNSGIGFLSKLKYKFSDGVIFEFDKKVIKSLKKYIKLPDEVYYSELNLIIKKLSNEYEKLKNHNQENLNKLEKFYVGEIPSIELNSIPFEEVEYYANNSVLLLPEIELENLKKNVRDFLRFKLEKIELTPKHFEALNTLFPLITFNTENRKKFDKKMLLTLVDEMLLINGIEFLELANKTTFMIGLGDLNQLNLEYDFNVGEIYKKVKHFYNINKFDDVTHYSITFNQFSNFSNMFNVFKEMGNEIHFLFDNFRSVRSLVEPQIELQPLYEQYLVKVKKNPHLKLLIGDKNKYEALTVHSKEKSLLKTENGEIEGSCFIKDVANKDLKQILLDLNKNIELQNKKDTLIITLFDDTYLKIKRIIRNNNLQNFDVLPIQKIQSLEYSNVVLLVLGNNEYEKISRTHQILTLSISRAKHFFFLLENEAVVGDKLGILIKNINFKRIEDATK